jgi:hypothetical protein
MQLLTEIGRDYLCRLESVPVLMVRPAFMEASVQAQNSWYPGPQYVRTLGRGDLKLQAAAPLCHVACVIAGRANRLANWMRCASCCMSLEEEQLIASSELSLQISHCFMISDICFSMSYMYFDLGTQTKK